MDFSKVFKITTQNVKTAISRSIKNNVEFSCQIADNKIITGDSFKYPSAEATNDWMNALFSTELRAKPLNSTALAAMKAKNITPNKQPNEILLIVISASETDVHVGISIPTDKTNDEAYKGIIGDFMNDREYKLESKGTYVLIQYASQSSIKEQDELQAHIIHVIKKRKIYIEETSADDVYYGLDQD